MSNSDWHQRVRQEAETFMAEGAESNGESCRAGDLKGLLHSIVEQISDADRRHSETLSQMQERLSSLGHEARSMRARVPENFQPAFERIEAGVSELASRIADVNFSQGHDAAPSPDLTAKQYAASDFAPPIASLASIQPSAPTPTAVEPPMALRSALDQNQQSQSRKRDEETSRGYAGFDTFDVIESLPGNTSDPWDRDSAEALANLYDPVDLSFNSGAEKSTSEPEAPRTYQVAASAATAPVLPGTADHSWFETRFSEIASHIDQALADVRPDQSFFAIGQRLDQFEHHFGQAFENVATRGDVESVRLIEAHMSELVDHLENTSTQLARLDALENQIGKIAEKLEDVHRVALDGVPGNQYSGEQPAVDVAAIAKAAAREAATFISAAPQSGFDVDEMRSLFERTMSEVRLGDENTTVLLDTLQQAMIRLLDRVDAIELNQHRIADMPSQASPHDYAREPAGFATHSGLNYAQEPKNRPELDAAVAAVANVKSTQSPFQHAPGNDYDFADEFSPSDRRAYSEPVVPQPQSAPPESAPLRSSEKMRQDFIADARRAKMRLANENASLSDEVVITKPEDIETLKATKGPAKPAARPQTTVVKPAPEKAGPAISPRLVALGLAGLVALGGAWFFMPGSSSKRASMAGAAKNSTLVSKEAAANPANAGTPDKMIDAKVAIPGAKPSMAPPPDADFTPQENPGKAAPELNLHSTTHGQILPEGAALSVENVPMQGISVSTDQNVGAADIERARRQQAMASVSSNLGLAAGEVMPPTQAAHVPDAVENPAPGAAYEVVARKPNGPLDLPPATVGPLSLRLAAANGDPSAEFEVGARLAEGKGTTQNFKDAAKWYQRSAAKGFVQAQYRLGTLYERGLGMRADQARAEDWYTRAAEQGNVKAMHNLAVLSANQRGGSPDYAKAASWFSKAADYGLADSQFNLAVLYENGLGVPEDLKVAYKWLSLAARSGDKEAIRRRDILKGKLPGDDLAAAEGLVATYKATSVDKMANDARTAGEAWKNSTTTDDNG
jgi:localization factor PodJL